MRIIGGKWRGKKLAVPEGNDVRPTSDRARGALFNVLSHGKPTKHGFRLADAQVFDVFAGSGALGLEALSRGAAHTTFIDHSRNSLAVVQENITACRADAVSTVQYADATMLGRSAQKSDLVFLDPPYGQALMAPTLTVLAEQGWLAGGAICCAELGKAETVDLPSNFEVLDDRRYGAARILLLMLIDPSAGSSIK